MYRIIHKETGQPLLNYMAFSTKEEADVWLWDNVIEYDDWKIE